MKSLKKILVGIALIIFGSPLTVIGFVADAGIFGIFGLLISIIGMLVVLVEYFLSTVDWNSL